MKGKRPLKELVEINKRLNIEKRVEMNHPEISDVKVKLAVLNQVLGPKGELGPEVMKSLEKVKAMAYDRLAQIRELKKKKEELEMARKSELVRPPDKSGEVKEYLTRVSEERKGPIVFPTEREK